MGFFDKGETRADLKCVRKHPSESDKLTIDTIGVTNISIQSFSMPVGNESKSDDLHGADNKTTHLSISYMRQVVKFSFYKLL